MHTSFIITEENKLKEKKKVYKCKYIFATGKLNDFPSDGFYFLQEFSGLNIYWEQWEKEVM